MSYCYDMRFTLPMTTTSVPMSNPGCYELPNTDDHPPHKIGHSVAGAETAVVTISALATMHHAGPGWRRGAASLALL